MFTLRVVFAFCMIVLSAGLVSGQSYPNKPIRLVTTAAGGGGDFAARLISQGISGPLGQPVIVENRGGGVVPPGIVAKAVPDGYTLLVTGSSHWLTPLLQANVPFDPIRDFSPVIWMSSQPLILGVHPSLTVTSVKELIAVAKARPGQLNYSSANAGGSSHLFGELFKSMAGVNIVRVPYVGNAGAITALLGGEVQLMFLNAQAAEPHIKSGKIRPLAVTSSQPSALVPGLPTMSASGVPGYEAISVDVVFTQAQVPSAIVNRLNQEIARLLRRPDIKEKLLNVGNEVVASSPEQLAAFIKSEVVRWGKVIKDAGISVN